MRHDFEVVEILLKKNPDVCKIRNQEGKTPLMMVEKTFQAASYILGKVGGPHLLDEKEFNEGKEKVQEIFKNLNPT